MKDDLAPDSGPLKKLFGDDDLDDAVMSADDTGMLASEKLITEAEIEQSQQEGDV